MKLYVTSNSSKGRMLIVRYIWCIAYFPLRIRAYMHICPTHVHVWAVAPKNRVSFIPSNMVPEPRV